MQTVLLRKAELNDFQRATSSVISRCNYYTKRGKREQAAWFTKKEMLGKLKDRKNLSLILRDNGKIIAFVNGYFEDGDVFYLLWIGVIKEARGKGAGSKILHALENKLRKLGIHRLYCHIRVNNKESLALFKSKGYRKIARLNRFWYGQDFYIYSKAMTKRAG